MADIITASGTTVGISTGAVTSAASDTLAEFQALTYTDIGLVESLGEFGDDASIVTFAAIGDGRVRKSKGARDAGTMTITCAHDPHDAGQIAVEVAEATNNKYAFRIVLPDAPTDSYTDSRIYFRALVASKRKNIGNNDNVVRNTYNCAIDSQLYTAPSA